MVLANAPRNATEQFAIQQDKIKSEEGSRPGLNAPLGYGDLYLPSGFKEGGGNSEGEVPIESFLVNPSDAPRKAFYQGGVGKPRPALFATNADPFFRSDEDMIAIKHQLLTSLSGSDIVTGSPIPREPPKSIYYPDYNPDKLKKAEIRGVGPSNNLCWACVT